MTEPQTNRVTWHGKQVTNPWARVVWTAAVPFVYLWVLAMTVGMQLLAVLIFMGVMGGLFCLFFGAVIFGVAAMPLAMAVMVSLLPWFLLALVVLVAGHFVLRLRGRNGFFSGFTGTGEDGAFIWSGSFDFSRKSFRKRVVQN